MIQGSLVLTVIDFFKLSIEPAFFLEWKADADKLDMDMPANVYAYKHNTTLTHVPHKYTTKLAKAQLSRKKKIMLFDYREISDIFTGLTQFFTSLGQKTVFFYILVSNTFVIYSLQGKLTVWNIN